MLYISYNKSLNQLPMCHSTTITHPLTHSLNQGKLASTTITHPLTHYLNQGKLDYTWHVQWTKLKIV